MRRSVVLGAPFALIVIACSGGGGSSGFGDNGQPSSSADGGGGGGGGGNGPFDSGGSPPTFEAGGGGGGGGSDAGGDATVTVSTTIYAHTDDTLYSMDPKTHAVTLLGKFAGTSGATGDKSITDLAVNANNDVYVNSETVIYKAALPAQNGSVQLTKVASIAVATGQKFYALAFVPSGVFGANETLVGGDGNGELWAIDQASGATKDLGNFGTDPNDVNSVLGLSGDLVFYLDASNKPTGLATVRSCKKGTTTCINTSDYLVGVDMAAMKTAYTSGSPAGSLLAGIYGGSSTMTGSGIGFGRVFGLGAWEGSVYGFTRGSSGQSATPPNLLLLDTSTGKGSSISSSFNFTNGWSGAGVTTKVTVVVPPPPPPPPPPK